MGILEKVLQVANTPYSRIISLLALIQDQVMDARNVAILGEGGSEMYPPEFRCIKKTAKQSKEDMKVRKDLIKEQFKSYVEMRQGRQRRIAFQAIDSEFDTQSRWTIALPLCP